MNNILILLILTNGLLYGSYNFFIKMGGEFINPIIGALILQFSALIFGVMGFFYINTNNIQEIIITEKGIIYSIMAGISVGIAEILGFYIFSKQIEGSVAIPIIISSSVLFAFILSIIFTTENITIQKIIGLLAITIGTYILIKGN